MLLVRWDGMYDKEEGIGRIDGLRKHMKNWIGWEKKREIQEWSGEKKNK